MLLLVAELAVEDVALHTTIMLMMVVVFMFIMATVIGDSASGARSWLCLRFTAIS